MLIIYIDVLIINLIFERSKLSQVPKFIHMNYISKNMPVAPLSLVRQARDFKIKNGHPSHDNFYAQIKTHKLPNL